MSLQADIKKRFSGFTLEVSLRTESGVLGILGASGCGKSMTLKCIAGIVTPDEGRIVLNGRVLFDSEKKINLSPQKRNVGYLFQNYALFPNMTVSENIAAGIKGTDAEKKKTVERMAKLFKLEDLERRYPSQLSGGQQQRTALARILAYEPDVIMLDEPFSALDFYLKEQLQLQVMEVLKTYKGDSLLVTHSRDEVYRFCENSIIMDHGVVVTEGSTKGIFKKPQNVTAARLTGCKNIAGIQKLDSHRILVPEWGISLSTSEEVGENIKFAGIRAHDFFVAEDELNAFPCRWMDTLNNPFEQDVLLSPVAAPAHQKEDGIIWWKLNRERFAQLKGVGIGDAIQISVKPEDILLLEE